MQVDLSITQLMFMASGQAARPTPRDPVQMARLANRYASEKLGLAPGREPGAYTPVYETKARLVEEAVFETREAIRTEDVFEERPITETRDVTETRPVFEERAVLETSVTGERRLTRYDSLFEAGVQTGTAFAVTVGDGATATVRFESSSRISLTVEGMVKEFTFSARDGSFRQGLVDALNSIDGLRASYAANGRLVLETNGGLSLALSDTAERALDRLGFQAGVTTGAVVGYETVQTGTEEVVVGSEVVTVGVELVKIGEQDVVGSETVMTGTVSRVDGDEQKLVGLEKPDDYGTGVLGQMADSGFGPLPENYVELLFGGLESAEEEPTPFFEAEARAAYDEAKAPPADEDGREASSAAVEDGAGRTI